MFMHELKTVDIMKNHSKPNVNINFRGAFINRSVRFVIRIENDSDKPNININLARLTIAGKIPTLI